MLQFEHEISPTGSCVDHLVFHLVMVFEELVEILGIGS